MKYVIDTSVGFKWVVTEIDSDKATRLRDDFNNAIHDLLAPDFFPTEIANALAVADEKMVQKLHPAFPFIVPLSSLP